MDSKTQMGLQFLIIGGIIVLVYTLIMSITYLITQDSSLIIIFSIFAVVAFIGAILSLVGAILFLLGRKEFGEKHHKNVNLAVIIFVITIVFIIIFTIGFSFAIFITISSSNYGINSTPYTMFLGIQTIISAILGGLIYYFALIEIEDELGKKMLFSGIITSIFISIISAIFYMGLIDEIIKSSITNGNNSYMFGFQNFGGLSILGIIPSIFYIIAMYVPYMRIKEGKLIPRFLSGDGSTFQRSCPNCNRQIPFDSVMCPYCGKDFR
jgi:MFS family permease